MSNVQKMEMPYKHLVAKKNDSSKPYFMLAELLDNSISSWKKNGKKGELQVDVYLDETEKEIIVDDNAFGMSEAEIEDSMRLNKEKEGNSLNMFGVGMKNSAFWFGSDIYVETNNGDGAWKTNIATSKITNLNDTIQWRVVPSERQDRGTKVTIGNWYDDKRLSDLEFEQVVSVLQMKYQNYISEGVKVEITLFKKNGASIKRNLSKVKIKAQKIPEEKKQEFLISLNDEFDGVNLKYLKDLKERTIKKVNEGKSLKYKYDIPFLIEGQRKNITFIFGVQDESNKKNKDGFKNFYGLITLQDGRAINMPPISALDFTNDYTRTNAKRLFGWAELGHIFKPDNNKQEFNFGMHREDLLGMIKEIGSELELVADVVQNIVGVASKSKAGNSAQSLSKIQNALTSKSDLNWQVEKDGSDFEIKVSDGEPIRIKIKEISIENKDAKNYFVHAEQVGKKSDNEYLVQFNINHPIWKPLSDGSGNNIDTKIVTYPLVAIIGIASLGIKSKIISEVLGKEFDADDILSIINFISQVIIK